MRRLKHGKLAPAESVVRKRRVNQTLKQRLKHFRLLAIMGCLMVAISSSYLWYSQTVLSFYTPHISVEAPSQPGSEPRHITIETAGIDVSIQPALIKDGVWQTSHTSATHLFTSARPTEAGNIVIYAHNKKELFGNLGSVKVGDTISITTDTGTSHTYVVSQIKTVKPTAIEEVLPSTTEVLTLYTCTGFLDSQRLVVKAQPA